MSYTKEDVRRYHGMPRPGKIEVMPSKKAETQDDLTLAYSPGVAAATLWPTRPWPPDSRAAATLWPW